MRPVVLRVVRAVPRRRCHLEVLSIGFCLLAAFLTSSFALGESIPTGDDIHVNVYTTDIQILPRVAASPDGTFVVAWESYGQDGQYGGSFLRRVDADGTPLAGDLQIATSTTFDQVDPDIAMFDDGSFVVVWDASNGADGSLRGIFGRRFDSAGSPVGGEFLVNQGTVGDQNDAVVAPASDGGFVVAWETNVIGPYEELVARRFDSSGDPVGDDYSINVFASDDQEDIDLGVDASGNFVVVWESEGQDGSYDGVFGRRLDSTGQPMGGEFAVNTYTQGDQDNPALAVQSDGSFVVVWEDDTQGGSDGIWGRFFDSSGTATTTPFQVDASTGIQMAPRVALDGDGNAVVVWDGSEPDDEFSPDVYFRVFDTAGQPLTEEDRIPIQDEDFQYLPDVAFGSDGNGLVAWTSEFDDGVGEIYARRLLGGSIFIDGFESGDTAAWSVTVP